MTAVEGTSRFLYVRSFYVFVSKKKKNVVTNVVGSRDVSLLYI